MIPPATIPTPKSLAPRPLSHSSLSAIFAWHCRRYPLLKAQDIYKLIHQGVYGPGHIIASATAARQALENELTDLEARSQEPKVKAQQSDEELLEAIDPDGRLVRVNLRPLSARRCKVQGARCKMQNVEWLVDALVESARRVKGDRVQMKRRLAAAVRWCRTNLPRQAAELEQMVARAGESGYPAFHHSPAYSRAYRPAYRVILSDCLSPDPGVNHQDTKSQRAARSQKLEAGS